MSFKICVIGCGEITRLAHGNAYKKYAETHDDTVLAACCSRNLTKAESFKNDYGFLKAYSDWEEMLDNESPDAVCLNSPVNITAGLSCEILEKGYPLLLEKPPGMNIDELNRIIAAASKSRAPNMVAFNRRFMPLMEVLFEKAHQTGHIQNINCEFFRVNRTDNDFATTSIHGIDAVRFLANSDYKHVDFYYQELPQYGEFVYNVIMECQFTSGATATLRFLPMTGAVIERYTVNAGQSTFFANLPWENCIDDPGILTQYTDSKKIFELPGVEKEFYMSGGFYRENEVFFDTVRCGGSLSCDVNSAVQSVEIMDFMRLKKPRYSLNS